MKHKLQTLLKHKLQWLLLLAALLGVSQGVWGYTVYFDNTNTNWSNVYIYFYDSNYWDQNNGSGSKNIASGPNAMTHVSGNIWSYENNGGYTRVAFTKDSQSGYGNFYQTEAAYSDGTNFNVTGSLSSSTPLFTPSTTKTTKNSNVPYYSGAWSAYTPPTPYTVYFDNTNTGWSNVYIYFYSRNYWNNNGSGSDGIASGPNAMTHVSGNIWSYENNGGYTRVAFTKDSQSGYGNFYQTEAAYSDGTNFNVTGSLSSSTPLFTPSTTKTTKNSNVPYYSGAWSEYSSCPTPTVSFSSGSATVCTGQTSVTYSVAANAGTGKTISSYTWTVPSGWSITSGSGTASITVTVGSTTGNQTVKCQVTNSCSETSEEASYSVTVRGEGVSSVTTPTFDNVEVGQSGTKKDFSFEYHCGYSVTTSDITLTGTNRTEFSLSDLSVSGGTISGKVTFSPTSVGAKTAAISVNNGDATINLSATAVNPTVIRVKIDAGWSTPIKVYTWGGGEYFGSFPGAEMTSLGCNWYEYRTSGNVGTGGIIFSGSGCTNNCGDKQSKDATAATANTVNCYTVNSTEDSGDSNKRTVSKSGTCSSEFTSVTISDASVCVGSTVTLTKSSDPSTDVSWSFSSSSPSEATVDQDGVVTGIANGSVTITATASKSGYICKTATCTVTINANPTKPTISSYDASVCSNTAPTFTVATVSGVTYQMYTSANVASGDAVEADATSETLTADAITSATTYYVKATKSGCSVNSDNTNEITIRGTVAVKSIPTFTNPGIGNSQTQDFTFDVCGGALPTNFAVKIWNPSSGSDAECTTCPFSAGTPSYSNGICTIPVTFSPTASGTFTARLKLTWSGGNLLTNDFSATAACTITPTADNYVLGNNSYTYAPNTPRSVTVNKASGSEAYPTGTIYYAGSTDAPTNANTYAITYSTSETGNYCAASSLALGNLVISKANQAALSITTGTSNRCTSATPFTLEVSGGTTAGTVTYAATSTTGTVSLNTSTGEISASTDGSITVTATMAGNGNYNSITSDAKTFTFSQSPTISLSGSSIGGASATYPWEYMTITATTTPSTLDVTWTKTFTGGSEPANSKTESGDHNHTYKIKSAITASPNSDHYTIKANGSNSGCAAAEAEYNVYINAAPAEVCN